MTNSHKDFMNLLGLFLAGLGSLALTKFNKGFILINKDGSLRLGPPDNMTNETFRANNRAYIRNQKIIVPIAYGCMSLGFAVQIFARFL